MNIFKFILLALSSALICSPIFAATTNNVYKWKDKDGTVHYSQNAPQGQEAELMTTKTPRAPLPETGAITNDNIDPNSQTATSKPAITKDQATCEQALKAIENLKKPIVLYDGNVMTIEEKNEQLGKMEEISKVHCP